MPKQVGFGILIHPRKPLGFLGLAPKAESVGRFLESVSCRRGIASLIYAEQRLNGVGLPGSAGAAWDAGVAVEFGETTVIPGAQGQNKRRAVLRLSGRSVALDDLGTLT